MIPLIALLPNGCWLWTGKGCISKLCVNPMYMEPVTQTENLRRRRWRT